MSCTERAVHDEDHLPYEAPEAAYREEATQRYQQIKDDTASAIDGSDVGAAGFAATVTTWLATRQRSQNLIPSTDRPRSAGEGEWFDSYAYRSYQSGRSSARSALEDAGYSPPRTEIDTDPRHQTAVNTLYKRQRDNWRDLATDLREDLRQTLRDQVDADASIDEAVSAVEDRIDKVGLNRARKIADSEPAWAYNRAFLAEAEAAGVDRVGVDMTWETAGDQRVCAECAARSGTYSINKAKQLMASGDFPAHPLCRCRWEVA